MKSSNINLKESPCIGIFIPTLNFGGAERVILNLANEFVAQGLRVDLVLLSSRGDLMKYLNPNVRVITLNSSRLLFSIVPLIRYLRLYKPRLLLSAMFESNIIAIIAKILSHTNVKVVITEHTTLSYSFIQRSKISAIFSRFQVRLFYRYAELIISVSAGVAQDLKKILKVGINSLPVVHNPIVDDNLISLSLKSAPHPWLSDKKSPVILSVGRLAMAKDHALLIKAFSIVRSKLDSKLIILGDGPLRPELQRLIEELALSEFISMPGYTHNPYSYMRQSDLFVQSSRWEGFGNVIVEAMACNAPIVSTDCPSGPAEILEDGRWGEIVPVGNVDLLAQAILRKLKKNPTNQEYIRASQFSVKRAADQYLSLFNKIGWKK